MAPVFYCIVTLFRPFAGGEGIVTMLYAIETVFMRA